MKGTKPTARGRGMIGRALVLAVATLAVLGVSTATSAASPAPAAVGATAAAPAGEAQPFGGCRLVVICGTVFNNTPYYVEVCMNWTASGTDQDYQPAEHCGSYASVSPFSVYGAPQLVDVDAFYIPSGDTYWGAYAGIPKEWTHTRSGWWKFSNTTDVHIDLIT